MQVLCKLRGSVVPKAMIWSVPCSLLLRGRRGFGFAGVSLRRIRLRPRRRNTRLSRLQPGVCLVSSLPRTVFIHILWRDAMKEYFENASGLDSIWSGYTFILGFLIVFRSNQAYSRFWESVAGQHLARTGASHLRSCVQKPLVPRCRSHTRSVANGPAHSAAC